MNAITPEEIVLAAILFALAIVAGRMLGRALSGPTPRMRRRLQNIDVRAVRPPFDPEAHALRNSETGGE